ncbi:MAG TPA: diaminopimelate epimerase [Candidatus Methylomirabilis sp.]|jgi:diaminopimelate epimerase|nr:diaminopimelate epimerase [Candidatus Methylomirabilis sp.]
MTRFVKSHGLGNDYLVLEEAALGFPLTPGAIRLVCHRNYGVGSDGILLLTGSRAADFGLRIFNPDGSEAEKSGNGLRIFARYLAEAGHARTDTFTVETKGGVVRASLSREAGRITGITVEMGRASFLSGEIPVRGPSREVLREPLEVEGERLTVTCVSVGNPHCVILSDALDPATVRRLGPKVEHHPAFPSRINVQFARVLDRGRVAILIWERGAGFTLASGSSACAVAAACRKHGLTDARIAIEMPGGTLAIEVAPDFSLRMTGPAEPICAGILSADLEARCRAGWEPPAG